MRRSIVRGTRRVALVGLAVLFAGCGQQSNPLPSNDFNRPTDLAFMCLGAFDSEAPGGAVDAGTTNLTVSGRPMRWCHPPGPANVAPDLGATLQTRTFAFMPNSASGELSVIDADTWHIVDLDRSTGGYGRLPLGSVPEQISVSDDGCRLISANRGGTDLTLVDPAALLAPLFDEMYQGAVAKPLPEPRTVTQRISPRRADGSTLEVAPYEVAFLPTDTSGLTGATNLCPTGSAGSKTWKAMVTFPACDLVALIDLPSGDIVDSARVVQNGDKVALESTGRSPSCPVAGGGAAADGGVDADSAEAGTSDGGGNGTPVPLGGNFRPASIAIVPDGTHAYLSLSSFSAVLSFPVSPAGFGTSTEIELRNAVGSDRIRLGVDPYKETTAGFAGQFVGESMAERRYLYVIARDGTVRVVDLFLTEQECNTNVDPLNVPPPYSAMSRCIPVSAEAPSRPYPTDQSGPGLRFPSIPIDVAAVDVRWTKNSDNDPNPSDENSVVGGYAWVLTSSGAIYLVNIDPVRRQRNRSITTDGETYFPAPEDAIERLEPFPFANTRRDRNQISYSTGLDSTSGPPRVATPPPPALSGPYIESFYTKGSDNNAAAQGNEPLLTTAYFPDSSAVVAQNWSVVWEGPLISGRYGGRIDGPSSTLYDGANFCRNGVLARDQVTFAGCTQDSQCVPGFKCHRDLTVTEIPGGDEVTGLCIDPARTDNVETSCPGAFRTLRRYDIEIAHQSSLKLTPHLDELVRSALAGPCLPNPKPQDGGVDAGEADAGAGDGGTADGGSPDGGAGDGGRAQPAASSCFDPNDGTTARFDCVAGPNAGPNDPKRCLVPCKADADCRQGRICLVMGPQGGPQEGFCADAPPLENLSRCLDQLISYRVNAGRSYLVSGSVSGVLTSGVDDENLGCKRDPNLDPRMVSRIPIEGDDVICKNLPMPYDTDPARFVVRPDPPATTKDAHELFQVVKTPPDPSPCIFLGGANASDTTPGNLHVRALFRNSQLAFILTNIDRQPTTGFSGAFDVSGGFRPQSVLYPGTIEVAMPARLVVGPVDSRSQTVAPLSTFEAPYLFVVDQRRLGRGQGGGPTRGQVLRINPLVSATNNSGLQPSYEDFTRSGGLFPIQ